jgi:beta-lactam-binding protein with PASTA domain
VQLVDLSPSTYAGRPVTEVQAELAARGLQVVLRPLTTADVPDGQVIAVDPGGALAPGTPVTVTYAIAPPVVPAATPESAPAPALVVADPAPGSVPAPAPAPVQVETQTAVVGTSGSDTAAGSGGGAVEPEPQKPEKPEKPGKPPKDHGSNNGKGKG